MTRTTIALAAALLLASPAIAYDEDWARRHDRHLDGASGSTAWSGSARTHQRAQEMFHEKADQLMQRARAAAIAGGASTAPVGQGHIDSAVRALTGDVPGYMAWGMSEREFEKVPRQSGFAAELSSARSTIMSSGTSANTAIASAQVEAARRQFDRAAPFVALEELEDIVLRDPRPPAPARANPHAGVGSGGSDRGWSDPTPSPVSMERSGRLW